MRKFLPFLAMLITIGCASGPPQILSVKTVTPTSVDAGSATTITVTGQQFNSRTSLLLGTVAVPTTVVSSTTMTAALPVSLAGGTYPVSIVDAEPAQQGGTVTLATGFTVSVTTPAPLVSSATPTSLLAGQAQANLVLTGNGFLPSTTATLNGTAHAVTYTDAQHITVPLNSADLLTAQALSIVLTNAAPGGGSTGPMVVQVTNYTKSATNYTAYGDSITYGYKLASVTSAYPYLLAAANHLMLADIGVIGDQACDTMSRIAKQHDGYTAQPGTLFSYMIGTNDTIVRGAGAAAEATFHACNQGVVSWLAMPATAKVQPGDSALQASGGCTAVPNAQRFGAAYCAASGTLQDQAFVTYGAPVYLWLLLDDTAPSGASMQVTVDGAAVGTYPVVPSSPVTTANGSKVSVALVRVPTAAGTHAVTVAATGAGGGVLAIGTIPASKAGLPPVIVGDVPVQRLSSTGGTLTAAELAYSADVRADFAMLEADGLDLRFAADRSTMLGSNPEMVDNIHPNELGQQHMEAAFSTGVVALNGTGGLVAQTKHGATRLPSGAVWSLSPREEGATFVLPSDADDLMTLRNGSGSLSAWVSAEALIDGQTGMTLAPQETVTLRRTTRGWTRVITGR